jgi:hypothetical protein
MQILTNNSKIHFTLRVAVAMCFIGHGAFGIVTKAIWCNYFALFGISHDLSYRLMPVLGSFDILLGIIFLFKPVRAIASWLLVWGFVTALCRPLSGEPFAEFLERAGNFGAPLCILLLAGSIQRNTRWLFSTINPNGPIDEKSLAGLKMTLRVIVFLLLTGHGWLNLLGKPALLNEYSTLGFSNPMNIATLTGIFEIMAAIAVLVKPARPLIFIFLIWKMGSELFYPHFEILEWIERGGSYGTLLALFLSLDPIGGKGNSPAGSRAFTVYS